MIVFDIETEPLPDDELIPRIAPFEPPALPDAPGEFDESTVSYGNTKDPVKRAAKLEEWRERHAAIVAAHAAAVANHDATILAAREKWLADAREKAALSAATGRVVCIGYWSDRLPDNVTIDHHAGGDPSYEPTLLSNFWDQYRKSRKAGRRMVGLNIFEFDLPFLIRRSWMLGVEVPATVNPGYTRYGWDQIFIDLRQRWLIGQQGGANGTRSGFNALAAAFGTPGKFDGIHGGEFAKLWREDRQKAVAYLRQDLMQPVEWARRMGVLA